MTELVLKVRSLKMLSWLRLIGENVGWKMVYNFLGIDEKTLRNLPTFDQNVRTVYSNIRTVYPSKNHVTTHPVNALQMRAHIVILDQSRGKLGSRSIVGSIFTFLVSNIHYLIYCWYLSLYNLQQFLTSFNFFCKKSKSNHKVIVK